MAKPESDDQELEQEGKRPGRIRRFLSFAFEKVATKKNAKIAGIAIGAAAVLTPGGLVYNYAGPNQMALRTTFGVVSKSGVQGPGFYFHLPLIQYTHTYDTNVQSIRLNAGAMRFLPFGGNAGDQNTLMADVTLNYRVLPDAEKLGFHRNSMDGWFLPDGYWSITYMMNDSANAVMGSQSVAQTIGDPAKFAREYREDLAARMAQSNMPVYLESIEVHGFKTFMPIHAISYVKDSNPQPAPSAPVPKL